MYALVKIKKNTQDKIFKVCITIILFLLIVWWVLVGLQTQLDSLILVTNTETVLQDNSKIKVEYINEDGTLYLEDTTSVEDSKVSSYVLVKKGTGTYYIPEDKMSREITSDESWDIGYRFIVLTVVVYIASVLLLINAKGRKIHSLLSLLLFFIISVFTMVILEYFISNIIESKFPVQEIITIIFILYCVGAVILSKLWKKRS